MQQEIKVRELAEQFFIEEINKLNDTQRKEEVELEMETYIGVYMKGFRAGEQHPGRIGWVKASEFKYEAGVAYHAKDKDSKGAGSFDECGIFIWGDDSLTLPENQSDLLILDESNEQPASKIDREWISAALIEFAILYYNSKIKDISNDAAEYLDDKLKDAGVTYVLSEDEQPEQKENEAVGFGDWLRTQRADVFYGSPTTTELYNEYKKQNK